MWSIEGCCKGGSLELRGGWRVEARRRRRRERRYVQSTANFWILNNGLGKCFGAVLPPDLIILLKGKIS